MVECHRVIGCRGGEARSVDDDRWRIDGQVRRVRSDPKSDNRGNLYRGAATYAVASDDGCQVTYGRLGRERDR